MTVATSSPSDKRETVQQRDVANDISVFTINASWNCPVKCSYCHITKKASLDDRRTISREELIRELRIASRYNFDEFRFSGGEPTILGTTLFEYADLVSDIAGKKPSVLTSGIGLNDAWLKRARGKFSGIYISVENPLKPMQTVVSNKKILRLIRDNVSEELPLRYGLTLIAPESFKDIETIFEILYHNVDCRFMPQLDYPCLKDFSIPTSHQLDSIHEATRTLFSKYGLIPYYFVNLIGSPIFLHKDALRIVLNLHPDGRYNIYDEMSEAWRYAKQLKHYTLRAQRESPTCAKCEWKSACTFYEGGHLMYDWCNLRRAIWSGIHQGIGANTLDSNSHGAAFLHFIKTNPKIQDALNEVTTTTALSTGT